MVRSIKEELPLCSPEVVDLYELALIPFMLLLSLPGPYFPKRPFTDTQEAFEGPSMKLFPQLSSSPSPPSGGFGILLLPSDFYIKPGYEQRHFSFPLYLHLRLGRFLGSQD